MSIEKAICEFCYEPIGYVDIDKLSTPLKPEMFSSLYPGNDVPPPFHPDLEWKHFKCPICRLRPYLDEEHISIVDDRGNRTRIKVEPKKYQCEKCGKEYAHQSSLARHKKECNG